LQRLSSPAHSLQLPFRFSLIKLQKELPHSGAPGCNSYPSSRAAQEGRPSTMNSVAIRVLRFFAGASRIAYLDLCLLPPLSAREAQTQAFAIAQVKLHVGFSTAQLNSIP
jgi:hypothetical protein